jgi:hypothetical protein
MGRGCQDCGSSHVIELVSCRIRNLAAKHHQWMLQSDSMLVEGLSLTKCVLESDAAAAMICFPIFAFSYCS